MGHGPPPKGWLATVNLPADEQEETMIRDAIQRKGPVGSESWVEQTARALGVEQSLRPRDPAAARSDGANARVRAGNASNGSRDLYFVRPLGI